MQIVRFLSGGQIHLGKRVDDSAALAIEGDVFSNYRVTDRKLKIEKLLSPLVPTDILCIGLNYREHAKESGSSIPENPMLFIKSSNSLNNPFDPIPVPRRSIQVDYEPELALVIDKPAK
jgi:2-keto-4-pentenoate hydratase/2-oxohepta-3-ene-1,7-dioic acid hydratase in catechol pathway